MTTQDDYEATLEYSQIYEGASAFPVLWPGQWWKPNGDPTRLSRLVLPEGGFVEFSRAVSQVHFYWVAAATRSAKSWTVRQDDGTSTAAVYLTTGSTFITEPEPPATEPWMFAHNFGTPIVALEVTGPCTITSPADSLAMVM